MLSIDNLKDSVAKYILDNKNSPSKFIFIKIDLKYAYSQIPLHQDIKKHCNSNILMENQRNLRIRKWILRAIRHARHIPKNARPYIQTFTTISTS